MRPHEDPEPDKKFLCDAGKGPLLRKPSTGGRSGLPAAEEILACLLELQLASGAELAEAPLRIHKGDAAVAATCLSENRTAFAEEAAAKGAVTASLNIERKLGSHLNTRPS